MRIAEEPLEALLARLPQVSSWNAADAADYDVLVMALGFEDRCIAIAKALRRHRRRVGLAIMVRYNPDVPANSINESELGALLADVSEQVVTVEEGTPDLGGQLEALLSRFGGAAAPPTVAFDISSCANRLIVGMMSHLLRIGCSRDILYVEAATYTPTKKQFAGIMKANEPHLAPGQGVGVSRVTACREYPGVHLDQLPDAVMLFPTFRPERTQAVLNWIDPALVTEPGSAVHWLIGRPHLAKDRWREQAMRDINGVGEGASSSVVSTFDYRDALRELWHLYDGWSLDRNVSISMLGSKLQAVGDCLFLEAHRDVRAVLSAPVEYEPQAYSVGSSATWVIRFGATRVLVESLMSVGNLSLED